MLLLHQRGIPFHPYFGEKSAMFVPTDFNWIGSFNSETGITAMWHTAKVKTFEDVFTETAVLGGSGPNDSETYPFLMNNTIGTKFKIVSGYKSNVTAWLAMERGEVEGVSGSWASLKAQPAALDPRQAGQSHRPGRPPQASRPARCAAAARLS